MQRCWLVLIVLLGACIAKPTSTPIKFSPNPPTAYATLPNLPPTKISMPVYVTWEAIATSATPTFIPTITPIIQPVFEDIKWNVYRFDKGVTFEHPSEWNINIQAMDFVRFSVYEGNSVRAEVYDRPVEDSTVTNPHSWGSNEGGYEVLWEKPISIEQANGLEFIWGQQNDRQVAGELIVILYSEQYELDVRLVMEAATIPTNADKFRVFEHMVQSIRLTP